MERSARHCQNISKIMKYLENISIKLASFSKSKLPNYWNSLPKTLQFCQFFCNDQQWLFVDRLLAIIAKYFVQGKNILQNFSSCQHFSTFLAIVDFFVNSCTVIDEYILHLISRLWMLQLKVSEHSHRTQVRRFFSNHGQDHICFKIAFIALVQDGVEMVRLEHVIPSLISDNSFQVYQPLLSY